MPVSVEKKMDDVTQQEVPRKRQNDWIDHVKEYKKSHPEVTYKDALKAAGETYTKKPKKEKKSPAERKPNPWMQHIQKFKDDNPNWKDTHSYKEVLQLCKDTYKKE